MKEEGWPGDERDGLDMKPFEEVDCGIKTSPPGEVMDRIGKMVLWWIL